MSQLEFRVVVDRAGIKSIDHYFNIDRAEERAIKLMKLNQAVKSASVFIQQREVSEWENVSQ